MSSKGNGGKIFKANCAACHAGGVNRIMANKTLKKDALVKYNMYSREAIIYQVTNGKNAMPPFRGRLSPEEIQTVTDYVFQQADNGWS
ncbi:MAG: c-type cytochrome [Cyanobacteria bacterium J06639_18]